MQLKQKLILTFGIIASLIFVFFSGKNIPAVYSVGKEILYYEGGYFKANNGIFGGPSCGIQIKSDGSRREGNNGYFTKDLACKKAYGPSVVSGFEFSDSNISVDLCGLSSNMFHGVECITPASPPCAELNNGVCQKIDTSLFQGGDKIAGQISTKPEKFIVNIFLIILSFAGGIALLLILSSGYKIIISKGKPESIAQGKEQLISAIVGLVFIIFSFIIFQLVFVDLLKIPGIS